MVSSRSSPSSSISSSAKETTSKETQNLALQATAVVFAIGPLFVDLPAVSPDILVLGMVGNTSPHDDGYKGVRKAMQKLSDKQPEYLR